MKKKLIASVSAVCVMVAGIFVVANAARDPIVVQALGVQTGGVRTAGELQAENDELRAIIQMFLANMSNGAPQAAEQQAVIPQISSQSARDIAVELVGYGIASDVMLFSEDGALLFEVVVRNGAMRYMVYVSAVTGEVVGMSSFNDGVAAGGIVPQTAPIPAFSPSPSQWPTSSPQVSASPRPSSSPSVSASPRPTSSPQVSASPRPTPSPRVSASPRPTSSPRVSASPRPTSSPSSRR
ncbi:MAG: hypothetical protein FWE20_07310 [Defluviitaleaceae bacterium]|nr:hypothetical protein [Defluviitaleaceae bacterium]